MQGWSSGTYGEMGMDQLESMHYERLGDTIEQLDALSVTKRFAGTGTSLTCFGIYHFSHSSSSAPHVGAPPRLHELQLDRRRRPRPRLEPDVEHLQAPTCSCRRSRSELRLGSGPSALHDRRCSRRRGRARRKACAAAPSCTKTSSGRCGDSVRDGTLRLRCDGALFSR